MLFSCFRRGSGHLVIKWAGVVIVCCAGKSAGVDGIWRATVLAWRVSERKREKKKKQR